MQLQGLPDGRPRIFVAEHPDFCDAIAATPQQVPPLALCRHPASVPSGVACQDFYATSSGCCPAPLLLTARYWSSRAD